MPRSAGRKRSTTPSPHTPDRAVALQLDVTDTARIADVVADTVLWYGRIDVVGNNAGMGMIGAVEETVTASCVT